ncbi:unnamed protein product [Alopecurus aequalis]
MMDSVSAAALRVVESCLVVPRDETPRGGLWLSPLDLVLAKRGHTPLVHVYGASEVADDFFDVAKLKKSMAKALVSFYPLAGRLGVDSQGRVEVNCNAEGAIFVVARSDHTVDDFVSDTSPSSELTKLFAPRVQPSSVMLGIQVTFLRCGGVVLGTAVHHAVVDGSSMFHFTRTWANYCRDGEGAVVVEAPPCHDRALLRARSPPVVHPETIPMFCSSLTMHSTPPGTSTSVLATQVFTISGDQLPALKHDCGGASTFCAVSALVWRCVCVARSLNPDATTRMSFPVDIRRRLTPPLPDGYFGNGVVNVFATASVKDVVSGTLASVAGRVKATAERLNEKEVLRSAVDYFEVTATEKAGGRTGTAEDRGNLPETEVRMNSWFYVPMYDTDFGWGKPRISTRAEAVRGGWVYLLAAAGGGARVLLSLEAATLSKFEVALHRVLASQCARL